MAAYRFPGCRPVPELVGVFGDPHARVVRLVRGSKKRAAEPAGGCIRAGTTARLGACEIWLADLIASTSSSRCGGGPAAGGAPGSARGWGFLPAKRRTPSGFLTMWDGAGGPTPSKRGASKETL